MWKYLLPLMFACLIAQALTDGEKSTTPIVPIQLLGVQDMPITSNPFAEYPDLCEDSAGDIWVAYMQLDDTDREMIILKRFRALMQVDSFEVSTVRGYNDQPRVVCDAKGRVWIVWASKREGNWDIYARSIERGVFSQEMRLTNLPSADLHPSIVADGSGDIWIAFENLGGGNSDISVVRVSGETIGSPVALSTDPHGDFRPALVVGKGGRLTGAWDRQVEHSYRIYTRTYDGRTWSTESLTSPETGFHMAPALAVEKSGALLFAWHSNLNPDGSVGLSPWVHLVRQQKGKHSEYWTLAAEGDQFKTGEDQGLEFPTLVVDARDRLWVFGRPSQGFYAQVIAGGTKSPLYRFGVEGWGGRGLFVRALRGKDGLIHTVRRDLRAIYLTTIDPLSARPALRTRLHTAVLPSVQQRKIDRQPELPLQLAGGYRIAFGDLHQHSALSDGMGTPDQCYTRSRYVMGHDFAALTDHEWFTANLLLPSEWEWIKLMGQQYDRDPEFVAFAAYEWTTPRLPAGFGHKNVYFADWDEKIFSFTKEATTTPSLYELLRPAGAIAIPHHIGWTGADWDHHDEVVQPDVEIVSTHGAFEYMGNEPIMHRGGMTGNFVQDGLARGLRFGIIGSTDGHGLRWHHGIGRKENEWETGLVAAIVKAVTKPEIMAALKARRVYATSGTRISMEFRINDHWMGDTLVATDPPLISLAVGGTGPLHSVTLLRNNEPFMVLGRDFSEGRGVRASVHDTKAAPGRNWYYVRVLQQDGEMAWSSPIWVEVRTKE